MENLLTVALEAHNPERNHHRSYEVTLGRDLFGDWTVEFRHGRCGQAGQGKRFASPEADEVRTLIRDRLRRRLTAPKRIGCPYRLVTFDAKPGFNTSLWLSGDLMAEFFQAANST